MQTYCTCVHVVDQCPAKHQPGPWLHFSVLQIPQESTIPPLCHRPLLSSPSSRCLHPFFLRALWGYPSSLGGTSMYGSTGQLWSAPALLGAGCGHARREQDAVLRAAPACSFSAQSGTASGADPREELCSASMLKFN